MVNKTKEKPLKEDKKKLKWSDGFYDEKDKDKKSKKPNKNSEIEFEDGSVVLIDEVAECSSITGDVKVFAVKGGSLKVNGKKRV